MPPKAASKPGKQSTLGSFFSLPAGTKPPVKQQSKLKFGEPKRHELSTSEDEGDHVVKEEEAVSSAEELYAPGSAEVAEETEETEAPVVKEEEAATEDEVMGGTEEEEVVKRKSKEVSKPKKAKGLTEKANGAASKKRDRDSSKAVKEESDELASEEEPVTKRGRKGKDSAATLKNKRPSKAEAALIKKLNSSKTKPAAEKEKEKSPTPKPEKSSASSEAEEEVEEEEEEEEEDEMKKPALAPKARAEMQQRLIEKGKSGAHPYPDWPAGSPVPYAALVASFNLIEGTTKRLEKLAHTSLFLRQVLRLTPDELLLVIHLMINRLAADYEGIELGIGESLLMKAIGESCGRSVAKIKEDHKETGDLGEVAMKSRNTQKTLFAPKPLTIKSVHAGLKEIATTKGDGGQGRKVAGIKKLLSAAKGDEAKFLVRGLEGKLRLGLAEKTVIVGLSQAVIVHQSEEQGKKASVEMMTAAEGMLKEVYSELPNYDIIIPEMLKNGIMKLKETCKLQPGVPLKPMLAKPTKAISEVLDRFENKRFTCEYKYDGERVQIHYVAPDSSVAFPTIDQKKGAAKIFSRNSEELSPKYPDILKALDKWVKPGTESFVLDCEAVAWDEKEKRVLPFQQLMTRKKKDVAVEDIKIKAHVFAFDLLFLNGKSIVQETLEARRNMMQESFTAVEGEFGFATYTDGRDIETIQSFLEESIKASCEGLMVKMLDGDESGYEPSKRSRNWLKVKKDYLAGAGDSLDLVVIGGYHGRGKRTNVYGAFTLACYNPSSQEFETICNIGTGFSEELLSSLYTTLSEYEISKPKPYYLHAGSAAQQPDVWFEPKVVWEVKAADLSLSPKYKAAAGLADKDGKGRGVSLRFPRYIRDRDDKKPEDATTANQVAEMYRRQEVVSSGGGNKKSVDDDFEY